MVVCGRAFSFCRPREFLMETQTDMGNKQGYRIGNTQFATENEYLAAVSDLRKVKALMDRYDVKDPEMAKRLLSVIYAKPQMFQTEFGRDFVRKLEANAAAGQSTGAGGESVLPQDVEPQEEAGRQAGETPREEPPAEQKTKKRFRPGKLKDKGNKGNKGKNRKKRADDPMSQEEQSVCYDILLSSLEKIFELDLILNIVWYLVITVGGFGSWFANLKKMIVVPVLFFVALYALEICFERLQCAFNDYVLLLVVNLVTALILAGDRMTHSIQMMCAIPVLFGLIYHRKALLYVQLTLSAALLIGHHLYIVYSGLAVDQRLLLPLELVGMLFTLCSFSLVVQQIRKFTQMLDTQSTIDSLTRLHNHEAFYEALDEKLAEYKERSEPLCVLIADIDNFKKVNDTYGHAYGDKVLKALADIFYRESSNKCFTARYGGEEFAMIMEMNLADALTRAQAIRKTFENQVVQTETGEGKSFTVSIGVAVYDTAYATSSQFFEKADEALYRAKAGGKNRVCL